MLHNIKVIFISRDVKFHESIFPFRNSTTPTSIYSLPLPVIPISNSDSFIPETQSKFQSQISPCTSPTSVKQTLSICSPSTESSSPIIQQSLSPTSSSLSPTSNSSSSPVQLRRSTRVISKPSWLNDFVAYTPHSIDPDCIATDVTDIPFVSAHFSSSYLTSLVNASKIHEPSFYNHAKLGKNWALAMQNKLSAL